MLISLREWLIFQAADLEISAVWLVVVSNIPSMLTARRVDHSPTPYLFFELDLEIKQQFQPKWETRMMSHCIILVRNPQNHQDLDAAVCCVHELIL